MSPSRPQGSGLRKFIIPLLLIAAIFFFLKSGDDTETPTNTETKKEETAKNSKASESANAEKLGIAFEHPASWGEIDGETSTSLAMVFNDACVGTDCDSLFVQKMTSTDPNFAQLSQLVKTLEKVETRPGFTFYQDTEKKVVTANKLFADNDKGTIYTFELAGKTSASEKFDTIIESLKEIAVTGTASNTGTGTTSSTTSGATPGATTTTTSMQTFKFQSCGDLTNYAKETFYTDFVTNVTRQAAFSDPVSIKTYGKVMLSVNDVKQGCYSSEGKIFLALVPKGPGSGTTDFHLFKFDLAGSTLAEAEKRGNWSQATGPTEFGKRDGQIIHMKSSAKEGTCIKETAYDYNYIENVATAKESCKSCEGQAEKQCEKL